MGYTQYFYGQWNLFGQTLGDSTLHSGRHGDGARRVRSHRFWDFISAIVHLHDSHTNVCEAFFYLFTEVTVEILAIFRGRLFCGA